MSYFKEEDKARKKRNQAAMFNAVKRMKMEDRVEWVNGGTCLLDGKWYFYAQKKTAKEKWGNTYYQMRGMSHFLDVFGKGEGEVGLLPVYTPRKKDTIHLIPRKKK